MLSTASDRVRTGWPPRRRSDTVSTRPARMRQTSVDVPPISKVTASATPVRAPTACAAATPPAGPDISIASGTLRAPAGVAMPPLDCIRRSGARSPVASSPAVRSARYRSTTGISSPFAQVVWVRSYSRYSALMSEDRQMCGAAPASSAASRRSWVGLA